MVILDEGLKDFQDLLGMGNILNNIDIAKINRKY